MVNIIIIFANLVVKKHLVVTIMQIDKKTITCNKT